MKPVAKAFILEDEVHTREGLMQMIDDYCEGVSVIGFSQNIKDARQRIIDLQPDIIFLDIDLPDGLGYDLVAEEGMPECTLIFTTAYNHYAMKAFELGAIHYLLKPIDPQKLREAVERALDAETARKDVQKTFLKGHLSHGAKKIAIPIQEGFELIALEDIIYFEATGTYTNIHIVGGKKKVTTRTLLRFEELLEDFDFVRIHDKYIVDFKKITKYIKGRGGQVVMTDGSLLGVSVRKRDRLKELLNRLSA